MSTSSSAAAPARAPEPESTAPAPFPYAEAELPCTDPSISSAEKSRLQQAQAFEQGRQQGIQQARAEFQAALQSQRDRIGQTIEQFAAERQDYYRRIEAEVVQLALAIARKILHREAQLDQHALAGIVRVTLDKLDAGAPVTLYVHPKEAADWRHYFAYQTGGALPPEVHEDPALSPGECRVETSVGTTEVGFESQLKEIETGLLDLLAERPQK